MFLKISLYSKNPKYQKKKIYIKFWALESVADKKYFEFSVSIVFLFILYTIQHYDGQMSYKLYDFDRHDAVTPRPKQESHKKKCRTKVSTFLESPWSKDLKTCFVEILLRRPSEKITLLCLDHWNFKSVFFCVPGIKF